MRKIKAGVVARAVVELGRDIESRRGRMGAPQSTRGACAEPCRSMEGLFESLLAQSFDGGRSPKGML